MKVRIHARALLLVVLLLMLFARIPVAPAGAASHFALQVAPNTDPAAGLVFVFPGSKGASATIEWDCGGEINIVQLKGWDHDTGETFGDEWLTNPGSFFLKEAFQIGHTYEFRLFNAKTGAECCTKEPLIVRTEGWPADPTNDLIVKPVTALAHATDSAASFIFKTHEPATMTIEICGLPPVQDPPHAPIWSCPAPLVVPRVSSPAQSTLWKPEVGGLTQQTHYYAILGAHDKAHGRVEYLPPIPFMTLKALTFTKFSMQPFANTAEYAIELSEAAQVTISLAFIPAGQTLQQASWSVSATSGSPKIHHAGRLPEDFGPGAQYGFSVSAFDPQTGRVASKTGTFFALQKRVEITLHELFLISDGDLLGTGEITWDWYVGHAQLGNTYTVAASHSGAHGDWSSGKGLATNETLSFDLPSSAYFLAIDIVVADHDGPGFPAAICQGGTGSAPLGSQRPLGHSGGSSSCSEFAQFAALYPINAGDLGLKAPIQADKNHPGGYFTYSVKHKVTGYDVEWSATLGVTVSYVAK